MSNVPTEPGLRWARLHGYEGWDAVLVGVAADRSLCMFLPGDEEEYPFKHVAEWGPPCRISDAERVRELEAVISKIGDTCWLWSPAPEAAQQLNAIVEQARADALLRDALTEYVNRKLLPSAEWHSAALAIARDLTKLLSGGTEES